MAFACSTAVSDINLVRSLQLGLGELWEKGLVIQQGALFLLSPEQLFSAAAEGNMKQQL